MNDIYYLLDDIPAAEVAAAGIPEVAATANTASGINPLTVFTLGNLYLPKITDWANTSLYEKKSPQNYGEELLKKALYGDPNKGIIGRSLDGMSNKYMKELKNYYSDLSKINFNFSNNQDVLNAWNSIPQFTTYNNKLWTNNPQYGQVKKWMDTALNTITNNFNNAINNMHKLNNLNALTLMHALGGALDYSLQNLYAINNYMNTLNKSKITSMPNSFYKPLFDSMNYFAMGGMPDFNEFNTGGTHELNPNGGIPQGMDKLGIMNTVELGETKTTTPEGDYIFSDRLKLSKEECKLLGVPKDSTYAEASKILRKEYDEMPNDEIARKGWEQSRDMLIQSLEIQKQEIALKEARKQGLTSPKMLEIDSQVMQDMYYNENPQEKALLQQGINPNILNAFGGNIRRFDWGGFNEENLRYIPAFGDTAAATRNMFAKPDYKYADRLDLMALSINTNIPTSSNYNYMTYNPVDIQRYLNNYNAQSNAARQAIMNTTNPSRNAALLAAQYNDLSGRGELMQTIDLVNKKHYNDVIVGNNAINAQRNADALNIANANFARQQYLLGLMLQANALKQAEDESLRAARSQQWTNAFNSLGALGQEALANKQANRWFELSKLAPGLTFELYNNILDGKAYLVKQNNGDYKYTEKS